jgi:excinuclease ABC subunit C
MVRGGKLIGRDSFILKGSEGLAPQEVLQAFIKQYYSEVDFIPKDLLLSHSAREERLLIEEWLSGRKGVKVTLKTPSRGKKKQLVEMAAKNAQLVLEQNQKEEKASRDRLAAALTELTSALGLERPPFRLECFDISNTQGTASVASMVVFEAGKPAREHYRRFKIRTVAGPDDFASMAEALRRRFTNARTERELLNSGQMSSKEAKFYLTPDLLIVDGGKGQLSAARKVMQELGFDQIPAFGLAEEEELLFGEGREEPIVLPRDSQGLYLLQRLRDEAHRFALTYHRNLRGKTGLKSVLDEIEGVGPARRKALLQAYGSVSGIAKATLEELAALPNMNKKTARTVYEFFH